MAFSASATASGAVSVVDGWALFVPFWLRQPCWTPPFNWLGSVSSEEEGPEGFPFTFQTLVILVVMTFTRWRNSKKAEGIREIFRVTSGFIAYVGALFHWTYLLVVEYTDMSGYHSLLGCGMVVFCYFAKRLSDQGYYPGVISVTKALAYALFGYLSSYRWSTSVMATVWVLEHWSSFSEGLAAWRRSECYKFRDHVLWMWEACGLQRASRIVAEPSPKDFVYPEEAEAHSALSSLPWVEKEEVQGMVVVIVVSTRTDGANRSVVFEPIGMGFAGNGVLGLPAHLLVGTGSIAELLGRDGYKVVFARAKNRLTANLSGTWALSPSDEQGLKLGNLDVVRAKHFAAGKDHVTSRDIGFLRCRNAGSLFGTIQRKSWDTTLHGINTRVCRYVRDELTGDFVLRWAGTNILSTTSLGMYNHTAGSVPGMSGALIVTSDNKVMGMNLGDTRIAGQSATGTLIGARQIGVVANKCCVPLCKVFCWSEVRAAHSKGLDKLKKLFQRGQNGDRHDVSGREGINDQSYEDDWRAYDHFDDEPLEETQRDRDGKAIDRDNQAFIDEMWNGEKGYADKDERDEHSLFSDQGLKTQVVEVKEIVTNHTEMLIALQAQMAALSWQLAASVPPPPAFPPRDMCAEGHSAAPQLPPAPPPAPNLLEAAEKCETVQTVAWLKSVKEDPDIVLFDMDREPHRSLFHDDEDLSSSSSKPPKRSRSRRRRPRAAPGLEASKVAHVKQIRTSYEGMGVGEAIRAVHAKQDQESKAPVKVERPTPRPAPEIRVAHTGFSFGDVRAATPAAPSGAMTGLCPVCLEKSAAKSCYCSEHEVIHDTLIATDMPEVSEEVEKKLRDYIASKCPSIMKTLEMGEYKWEKYPDGPCFEHEGTPFLVGVGTTRFKSGKPEGKATADKSPQPQFVDMAVAAGFTRDEVADFTWPDLRARGIFDSMTANLEKRIRHGETMPAELTEFIHRTVVDPPLPVGPKLDADLARNIGEWTRAYVDLEDMKPSDGPRSTEETFMHTFAPLVDVAVSACNPDKSAGWSGCIFGKPLKGNILKDEAAIKLVRRTALERLWLYCTVKDVAFCSAEQMVRLGLRDPVVPAVKGEMHPGRKVFKRNSSKAYVVVDHKRVPLDHPRWRTIYSQSMVDEIVGRVLEKPHNARQQSLYAAGAGVWTGIGTGSDDANARLTKARVTAALFAHPAGSIVSDDVSGMDWCGSGWSAAVDITARLATAHSCAPADPTADEAVLKKMIARALLAYGCSLARSTYLVQDVLFAQVVQGINDSGVLSTGFKNSTPRAFLAWLTGALGATACGDDCVAVYAALVDSAELTAVARRFGFEIRDQLVRQFGEGEGFECCSKLYSWAADPVYQFLNLPKAVAKVCSAGVLSDDTFSGLLFETRHDPSNRDKWMRFRTLLVTAGLCEGPQPEAKASPEEDPLDTNF